MEKVNLKVYSKAITWYLIYKYDPQIYNLHTSFTGRFVVYLQN